MIWILRVLCVLNSIFCSSNNPKLFREILVTNFFSRQIFYDSSENVLNQFAFMSLEREFIFLVKRAFLSDASLNLSVLDGNKVFHFRSLHNIPTKSAIKCQRRVRGVTRMFQPSAVERQKSFMIHYDMLTINKNFC